MRFAGGHGLSGWGRAFKPSALARWTSGKRETLSPEGGEGCFFYAAGRGPRGPAAAGSPALSERE